MAVFDPNSHVARCADFQTTVEPPDNIPRSLHDIWYAGYEAAESVRPVCAKHKTPKRAHYYCLECRENGDRVVSVTGSESY
jgi:hypothetical protein